MISQYISRLETDLRMAGLDGDEIASMLGAAHRDILDEIIGLVQGAVQEAQQLGMEMGADEFLSQIKLDTHSGYVEITTDSGELDFSTPPTPMLPWLLKNAKVAKDGSMYKVIPVGASSMDQSAKTIKNIDSGISAMRDARPKTASDMAAELSAAFGMGASSMVSRPKKDSAPAKPNFRVASSKQDSSTSWVKPAKDLDLTSGIMDINNRLNSSIDEVCSRVVGRYTAGI